MSDRIDQARAALRQVLDPETELNIVDLGLILDIEEIGEDLRVIMTLTSEACPAAGKILIEVEEAIAALPWNPFPDVHLCFDPPWTPDKITPEGRAFLSR